MGYRLPFVTSVAIFLLLIAGALVVGTDAGLACSDWPLCNGHIIPPMEGKIIIEYTHRMLSTSIGFVILANVYMAWRHRKESPLAAKLTFMSLVLLAIVAVLGGVNVLHKLPPGFTAMDTSAAMLLFATFVIITGLNLAQYRKKNGQFVENQSVIFLRKRAMLATVSIYLQIVLGAFIKHSDAGKVWVNGEHTLLNNIITSPAVAETLMYVHFAMTVLASWAILTLFFYTLRKQVMKFEAGVLAGLLALEIIAGFADISTNLALAASILHTSLSSLMFAFSVFITVETRVGGELLSSDNSGSLVSKRGGSAGNLG